MFDPVDPKQRLSDLEEGILQYWREEDTFKRSIRKRGKEVDDVLDNPELKVKSYRSKVIGQKSQVRPSTFDLRPSTYSFYDGPPFATGLPHYGHLLAGTIKDVIPRYQTMRGKSVERRFGWDCHGLPIENLIEKEHNIKDKMQIDAMGVAAFNALCRGSVQRYTKEWREVVERMGRFVDMDWDYKTMDPEFMESIWWVFSELQKKGLIYEGYKSMHVCPRCVTPLSNFEVTQGYKEVTDWSTIATFPLTDDPKTILLAWTTTSWTLPGNLFLALGPKITYAKVRVPDVDATYVVAKDLVATVFRNQEYEVIGTFKSKDLVGKFYEPLFPYFVENYRKHSSTGLTTGKAFRIVLGDFVATDEGTGIVHIAPGFGTDDYEIGKREKVEILSHVQMDGTFVKEVTDFAGMHVKPADDPTKTDKKISETLKKMGRLFHAGSHKHTYPHCWRCDSPLINYTMSSWFVAVEKFKEKILKANSATEWVPEHVRDGRFGKWLENARDWCISRNRYWGTPLPIWRSEEIANGNMQMANDIEVIGSREELMQHKLIRFTKVTALRHAESEGNLIPIYQGKLPGTDLTKNGRSQAKEVADWLGKGNLPVSVIYCSPLARTKQTAEIIAKKTGATLIVDERLREVDFGEWEGKAVDFSDLTFVKERRKHKLDTSKPESIYHFEGMESWDSVFARVSDFLSDILPRHRSEHIAIVTHADPMVNIEHFFTKEDPVKLSHRPYPSKAVPKTYFWDHSTEAQLDLHKETVDDITWPGAKSSTSVELTLVRHGETDLNRKHRIQGHVDEPLNDLGRSQAAETAKKLKKKSFDGIVCSDLPRARETADILSKELGVPVLAEWEELRERDVGTWSMQEALPLAQKNPLPDGIINFGMNYRTPENGESLSKLLKRMESTYERLIKDYAGKRIIVVAHSGSLQALIVSHKNMSYTEAISLDIPNADVITFHASPLCKRIPEVLDCWFESGSMPYAQEHFPFEFAHSKNPISNPNPILPHFPADFIAEGMDQTRGWFYTLTVLGAALFGKSPFNHCVVNGTVLAEDGKKMSKRLKNYPDPLAVVGSHGADAVRFALMSSPAVRGEDLRFSEKLVEETVRGVLLPLWNTYSFFVTYANAAKFEPIDTRRRSEHPLDVWIRAEVQDLVNRMTKELENYDLSATCAELHDTIDALTNWYVRLSRRRFAGKGVLDAYPDVLGDAEREDRHEALETLYDVLLTLSQLLAPFCPFITEAIFLNLVPENHGSIHLTDWPETRELTKAETKLLEKTRVMRLVVSLGNSIRSDAKVKMRQPLQKAEIALPPSILNLVAMSQDDLDILRQELNVKEVEFAKNPDELAEGYVLVDARKVGPRLGSRVQEIIQAGKAGEYSFNDDGRILILDEVLSPDEATLQYRGKEGQSVAADSGVVVSLNTELTAALLKEGEARDIIRGVQKIRKDSGLAFTDTITLQVVGADATMKEFGTLIASETRAELVECDGEDHTVEAGETTVTVRLKKL